MIRPAGYEEDRHSRLLLAIVGRHDRLLDSVKSFLGPRVVYQRSRSCQLASIRALRRMGRYRCFQLGDDHANIFLFARRFPFQRQHWLLRSLQYGVLGCFVVLTPPALKSPTWLYKPDQHEPFVQTLVHLGRRELTQTIQAHFILCLVSAYENTRSSQLREAELASRISVAELHMLLMQLNPHFLFSALQAATVLIHVDPLAAEKVLRRPSELLRVALDDMRSLQVPLEQEITFLKHYVEIQNQRFQAHTFKPA